MTLKTLADVRELVKHLPKDHRKKSTWRHVEKQLNAAAFGEVDTIDVAVPLQLALSMEGVECRQHDAPPHPAALVRRRTGRLFRGARIVAGATIPRSHL
jgi:hypothetical protein